MDRPFGGLTLAGSLPYVGLTAAIIVKNEADHLRRCLGSLAGVADEIVVVDTGSTDDSVAVAEAAGALVLHRPWDGRFSPPRNLGLDHATGEWILYIDADEEFVSSDVEDFKLTLDAARAANVVALQIRLTPKIGSTAYWEWRLWRHRPDLRFRGAMHEGITEAIADAIAIDPTLQVGRSTSSGLVHYGYEGDQTAKHHRNLPLIRAELERTPTRTYLWNHMGRCLEGLGRDDEAVEAWEHAIALVREHGRREHVDSMSYSDLAMRRVQRGEDVSELLDEALELFPENLFLTWVSALHASNQGRSDDVLELTQRLLDVGVDGALSTALSYDVRIFGEWPLHLRGNCLFGLGRYGEAAEAYGAASALAPGVLDYRVKASLARSREAASAADRVTSPNE